MAPTKVSDDQLRAYLDAGHSQAEAARHFGVTQGAVHQRLKRMKRLTSHVVALEKAGAVVGKTLSATARLERIQRVIDRELTWAEREAERKGADRSALQDTILKLTGEVRQQLGLQLSISRALVDLQVVREFQQTVIGAIREASPDTAARIVDRLKARRALRSSVQLPSLMGAEDADGFGA